MDALGGLLTGPRALAPFLLRMVMSDRWSVRIEDTAPLTVLAVSRGDVRVIYDDGEQHHIGSDAIALIRGTEPYTVCAHVGDPLVAMIDAAGDCYDPTGTHTVAEQLRRGVRSWGDAAANVADTVVLVGAYQLGEVSGPVLVALNRITLVAAPRDPLIGMLCDELVVDAPAQDAVLNRLLDLILVRALRAHFDADPTRAPRWYRAHRDPVVGQALTLLHNNIARPWTVDSLAEQVGMSRASLARRFTGSLGEPPMGYLTDWRLTVAADLLIATDLTVATISERVGYSSAFALSTAFKRQRGITPSEYRRGAPGRRTSDARVRATSVVD